MKKVVKYINIKFLEFLYGDKSMTRQELTERIIQGYSSYFDINRQENNPLGLVCRCDLHIHSEKFVLVRSAKLWEADCHEYVFLFSVKELTSQVFRDCERLVLSQGRELIKPKQGHMYTYLTLAFVCDSLTEQAKKLLKRARHYKSYRFSFHGWSDFRTYAVKAEDKTIFCNKNRKEFSKFIKGI